MKSYADIRKLLGTVDYCVKKSEEFGARMALWREVDETDIQTLDRLLDELRVLRAGKEMAEDRSLCSYCGQPKGSAGCQKLHP